ncbi:hypothetical protein [Lutibacter sp.]
MKPLYKLLLILFLIPLTVSAGNKRGRYTKTKTVVKEFNVNANATLDIKNKFGNIDIITWNENKIVITVKITTNGNNEDRVKSRLEQINIDFSKSVNFVSAKTIIQKNYSSWRFWGRKNNVNIEINYTVKMPVTNNVVLTNDYGGISIDKLEGSSDINCDYGDLNIGELWSTNNLINIDYTSKSTIDFMKEGKINADYSTLYIEKTERTHLNADYSHISFGTVTVLDYNCDYGSLKINQCENLTGNSNYMHATIEKLIEKGVFDVDYGSLKINELAPHFKSIRAQTTYAHIKMGVTAKNAFNITVSLNYGNFRYNEGFSFHKEIIKNQSKYYEGRYNNGSDFSNISIKSNYGNITFFNN